MPSDTSMGKTYEELNLNKEQQSLVHEYRELQRSESLSLEQGEQLAEIWGKAENDNALYKALILIEENIDSDSGGKYQLSQDINLRTYLSEYLPVLAQEKLDKLKGTRKATINAQESHIVMLCPDKEGYTIVKVSTDEQGFGLNEIKQAVCERCHSALSEHEAYLYPQGFTPDP